jgi:O-antigen/teichoic acid export membrane protein
MDPLPTTEPESIASKEPASIQGAEASGRMVRLSVTSIVASLGILILSLATGVMLARLLGPSTRGELTAVLFWPTILAMLGGLAVNESATYLAARLPGRERSVAGTALSASLALAVLVVAIGYLLLPTVIGHYGRAALGASRTYLAYVPIYLLWMAGNAVLLGKHRITKFNRARLAVPILILAGIAPLYVLQERSLSAFVGVYLLANLGALAYVLGSLAQHRWLSFRLDSGLIRPTFAYSVKAQLGNAARIGNDLAPTAIVSLLLPPALLGFYSIATSVTSAVAMLGTSVAIVAFPTTSAAQSISDKVTRLAPFVRGVIVVSAVASLSLALLSPLLIPILFGKPFTPAVPVAQILLVQATALSTMRILGAGLRGFNMPLQGGIGEAAALGITVAATLVLIPKLGIAGAALSTLIANVVGLLLTLALYSRAHILSRQFLAPSWSDVRWVFAALNSR